MKYTVLYAHPNPKSFNHAILERVKENLNRNRREYVVRDLYEMDFHPLLSSHDFVMMQQGKMDPALKLEQETIRGSDGLIVIHPIWWFSMPAMLKGYIDRVFSRGFAYDVDAGGVKGLLPGKKVYLFNTTGGTAESYRDYGFASALEHTIDRGTFGLCGMEVMEHRFFYAVPTITNEERVKMLDSIEGIAF